MAYLFAFLASLFFATSGVLIKIAGDLPPAEIGAIRLLSGAVLVAAAALATGRSLAVQPAVRRRFLVYGFILGLHFLLYIWSFSFTSIAHALLLVDMSPLFSAFLSPWLLKEAPLPATYPGMALAMVGVLVLTRFSPEMTSRTLLGDGLALAAGLCYALYSLAGRRERQTVHVLTYAFWVYMLAGLFLVPVALLMGGMKAPVGRSLGAALLMGLLPTAFGHTLFNNALRYGQATYVNLISTQEITGGILLGWLIIHEAPPPGTYLGGALGLTGIIWMVLAEGRQRRRARREILRKAT